MKLRTLDLFSGIGGFALGLERTGGFETVSFCEIDPFCRRVLAKHWPGVPCHEDVRTLRGDEVGPVDVVCGGFPCQDLSVAGRREGLYGSRSKLWFEFNRLIEQAGPLWAIVENVGHTWRRWVPFVRRDLWGIGYASLPVQLRASDFWAPHQRSRCFVIAHSDSEFLRQLERWWRGQSREMAAKSAEHGDFAPRRLGAIDGAANWSHRRKSVGNSVFPKKLEMVGHAILAAHHSKADAA